MPFINFNSPPIRNQLDSSPGASLKNTLQKEGVIHQNEDEKVGK
jgi:hypothetical protein